MEPDEQKIAIACVTALWDRWQENKPFVPADGDRVFTRWVDLDPEDPGWDDWSLIAFLKPDGTLSARTPDHEDHWAFPPIRGAVASGLSHGYLYEATAKVEWALFKGDAPGDRVSDWANGGGCP